MAFGAYIVALRTAYLFFVLTDQAFLVVLLVAIILLLNWLSFDKYKKALFLVMWPKSSENREIWNIPYAD